MSFSGTEVPPRALTLRYHLSTNPLPRRTDMAPSAFPFASRLLPLFTVLLLGSLLPAVDAQDNSQKPASPPLAVVAPAKPAAKNKADAAAAKARIEQQKA